MACCNDAIDGPPADFPPSENVSLGNALMFLAGVSKMYRELGSERVPIPIVRDALTKAFMQCKKKTEKKPRWRLLQQLGL